jgi:large subunit ribosomal protein L33
VCKSRNYTTFRHREKPKGKIILKKHCPRCRKHTEHKEVKISKK